MENGKRAGWVTQPATQIPVLCDADVVVAGSGISGTFAAIAAARDGAKTVVVERCSALGGNMGPGKLKMGSLHFEADVTLPGGLAGLAKEFVERVGPLLRHGMPQPDSVDRGYPYFEMGTVAASVAYEMMKEAGVELLLSLVASDPIVEAAVVKGIFVEGAAGRLAITAKVTVDATGVAEIARRAGAPMLPFLPLKDGYDAYFMERHLRPDNPTYHNDTELICLIAGVDHRRYESFSRQEIRLSPEDEEWRKERGWPAHRPLPLLPLYRRGMADGTLQEQLCPLPGVTVSGGTDFRDLGDGLTVLLVSCIGAVDTSDPRQVSEIEGALQRLAFSRVLFYRKNVPGFENAYLAAVPCFLGWRGGPCIDGERRLTVEEMFAGSRSDDVLYVNIHLGQVDHGGNPAGFDVPYGCVLPKGLDGLLVCGRGASYERRGHDPCAMRARPSMMVLGEAVGAAAALAVKDGVPPRRLDVRKLQRRLVDAGIFVGDEARLRQLGVRTGR
ncbi:MAG: FAD-dependent oxidoreductase [Anaerolineae bacterium]|nr:FAD-dependent oxidoreductase [Anaerolineae bacterium]